MKHKKNSRTFFTHGWIFFVCFLINGVPIWLGIPASVISNDIRLAVQSIIIFLFSITIPPFHWATRFIYLQNGRIIVRRPFFAIFFPVQHSVSIKLSDVECMELKFTYENSMGNKIGDGIKPCLILTKKDKTIERIVLLGYSNKQVAAIKQAILEENKEIVVLKDWINKE